MMGEGDLSEDGRRLEAWAPGGRLEAGGFVFGVH